MKTPYYITTPIYYVNDSPHIGHAYTSIACDVMARFKRLEGYEVKFLTGTDEHGQKVEKSAINASLSPQEFTDNISKKFYNLSSLLNLSNDDFIRTTELRHKSAAIYLWNQLIGNNHIYLGKYSGWYSIRDEAFYDVSELIDGKAPTGASVEWVEEESYFFDLSKWQDKLLDFFEKNPDFIQPKARYNEVVSFVKSGLHDLSISRTSLKWGIPIPNNDSHVMYVWLDALTNYISAINYPNGEEFLKFWPANVHVIGKDILRFHAIYWPAFLMAAKLPLPKKIAAHGWWTIEGEKMSKSLGNVISPNDLVNEFGVDATRYFLMREKAFGSDGNFSKEAMINRINSELANNIGNLIQRTLTLIQKSCQGKIPNYNATQSELMNYTLQQSQLYIEAMDNMEFNQAISHIINIATNANVFIDQQAPWTLAKTDIIQMQHVLYNLAEVIRYLGILLQPFTPDAAGKILDLLAVKERSFIALSSEHSLVPDLTLPAPTPIFPRFVV